MSETETQQKSVSDVTDNERSLGWATKSHDIGIQRLKEERNRITYGVKYADRYKSFLQQNLPAATATKLEMEPKCPLNSPNIKPNTNSPNFIQKHTFKPPSNPTSPKFNHKTSPSFAKKQTLSPNFPNKMGFKDKEHGRNATQDLNNSKNVSQLASYRIISTSNQPPKLIDYTEQNYYTVPNSENYTVNLRNKNKDDTKTDTMYTLENIQAYITECEEQQKLKKIVPDFPAIMTRPRTEENILSCRENSPNIDSKDMNHIQEPLKSFNEVENLLKPGVSDLEAEHREIKGSRHSSRTDEDYQRTPPHKQVHRTVSDARYRPAKVFEKHLQNPRPRKTIKVYFNVKLFCSPVWLWWLRTGFKSLNRNVNYVSKRTHEEINFIVFSFPNAHKFRASWKNYEFTLLEFVITSFPKTKLKAKKKINK